MQFKTTLGVVMMLATLACAEGADEPFGDIEVVADDDSVDVEHAVGSTVCFSGKSGDGTTCWSLQGDPFKDGVDNDAYYTIKSGCTTTWGITPIAYFRQWKMDRGTYVAPNFTLAEMGRAYTSQQYMLLQPHAVEKLQAIRNQVGALHINSGYRPPGYNYTLPGAAGCSRHMYGDAFDISPASASLNQLGAACDDQGGKSIYYTSHVHCDFRYDAADPRMFAQVSQATAGPSDFGTDFQARIVTDGTTLHAPAQGFDEGEPLRSWVAYGDSGEVLAQLEGAEFAPPEEASSVRVTVGGVIEANLDL